MKDGVRYNIFFVYFIMAKKNDLHWTDKVVASDPRKRTYKQIQSQLDQDIREQNDPDTISGRNGERAHAIAVRRARESHELLRNHELKQVEEGHLTDAERRAGVHHTHSMGFARHVLGTRRVMTGNEGKTLYGGRKRKRKTRKRKTKRRRKTKHRKRRRSSHKKRSKTRHRRRTRRRRR